MSLHPTDRTHARHRAQHRQVRFEDVDTEAVRADALRRQNLRAHAFERRPEARLLRRDSPRLCALDISCGETAAGFQVLRIQLGDRGLGQSHEHLHPFLLAGELGAVHLQRAAGVDISTDFLVCALRDRRRSDERCRQQHRRDLRSRHDSQLIHWMIPEFVGISRDGVSLELVLERSDFLHPHARTHRFAPPTPLSVTHRASRVLRFRTLKSLILRGKPIARLAIDATDATPASR